MTKSSRNLSMRNSLLFPYLIPKQQHEYPKYDNYDAINVNKTDHIPVDFAGPMGVPISFLDKHSPDQFEIVSANDIRANANVPVKPHGLIKDKDGAIDGKPTYVCIVIRNRKIQQ